ncbi:MAG: carboxymuconolactone decarboxylase family protein [Candidatus Obscuribacterales bacterium]|nr:carboxymuconolactone decarboxylase family protein [Steroidobacteraceae bacterium]
MREPFFLGDINSAPLSSKPLLARAQAKRSMVPNLELAMASVPALLAAYTSLVEFFEATSLTAQERQIVFLAASRENDCSYCSAWHAVLTQRSGLSSDDVDLLQQGTAIPDPKLDVLRRFYVALIRQRGNVTDSDLTDFLALGWTREQALEVIIGIGAKTLKAC